MEKTDISNNIKKNNLMILKSENTLIKTLKNRRTNKIWAVSY